jgi:hypothetical protein
MIWPDNTLDERESAVDFAMNILAVISNVCFLRASHRTAARRYLRQLRRPADTAATNDSNDDLQFN